MEIIVDSGVRFLQNPMGLRLAPTQTVKKDMFEERLLLEEKLSAQAD